MTRDEIMQMDDTALRLAVAKALGWTIVDRAEFVGVKDASGLSAYEEFPDWPHDKLAAIDLLDSMTYPDGVSVEYDIIKMIDESEPYYHVIIYWRDDLNSMYEAEGDTLALAASRAWLMWREGEK